MGYLLKLSHTPGFPMMHRFCGRSARPPAADRRSFTSRLLRMPQMRSLTEASPTKASIVRSHFSPRRLPPPAAPPPADERASSLPCPLCDCIQNDGQLPSRQLFPNAHRPQSPKQQPGEKDRHHRAIIQRCEESELLGWATRTHRSRCRRCRATLVRRRLGGRRRRAHGAGRALHGADAAERRVARRAAEVSHAVELAVACRRGQSRGA
jgi:hypothetical protein